MQETSIRLYIEQHVQLYSFEKFQPFGNGRI